MLQILSEGRVNAESKLNRGLEDCYPRLSSRMHIPGSTFDLRFAGGQTLSHGKYTQNSSKRLKSFSAAGEVDFEEGFVFGKFTIVTKKI
jgi:hypothetical protein